MWKYIKLALGALLIVASVNGIVSILDGDVEKAARQIVENGVETSGVIEKRTEHTVAGRKGKLVGAARYYTMTYSFRTLEGKTYSDEINVSKEQAYAVSDGQKIRVRYHANQPTINSALGFEEYMTEDDIRELPYGMMFFASFLMLMGGAWMAWSAWAQIRPGSGLSLGGGTAGGGAAIAQDRISAVSQSGGKATFGRR